jgi:hypothetical protein
MWMCRCPGGLPGLRGQGAQRSVDQAVADLAVSLLGPVALYEILVRGGGVELHDARRSGVSGPARGSRRVSWRCVFSLVLSLVSRLATPMANPRHPRSEISPGRMGWRAPSRNGASRTTSRAAAPQRGSNGAAEHTGGHHRSLEPRRRPPGSDPRSPAARCPRHPGPVAPSSPGRHRLHRKP